MTQKHWIERIDESFKDCEWYGSGSSHEIKAFITSLISEIAEKVEKMKEQCVFHPSNDKDDKCDTCLVTLHENGKVKQILELLNSYTKPE